MQYLLFFSLKLIPVNVEWWSLKSKVKNAGDLTLLKKGKAIFFSFFTRQYFTKGEPNILPLVTIFLFKTARYI